MTINYTKMQQNMIRMCSNKYFIFKFKLSIKQFKFIHFPAICITSKIGIKNSARASNFS